MYARICSEVSEEDLLKLSGGKLIRSTMIKHAEESADFVIKNGFQEETGIAYFSLNEMGEPHTFQRKIFSNCFMCLGYGALFKVTNKSIYKEHALLQLKAILDLVKDPSPFKRTHCKVAQLLVH